MRILLPLAMAWAAVLAAAGCSTRESTTRGPAGDASPEAGASATSLVFRQHIAAGSDLYRCAYVVPSAIDTFLVGASHTATAGTHHVLVFRTDLTAIPDGPAENLDCFAGPSSPMSHMRGEVYGSQLLNGSFDLPSGVGLPLRGGDVLLIQFHWLDASAEDIDASLTLTLDTVALGISVRAGTFFFDDPFIDIPAGAIALASMRCLVPDDITIVSAASHEDAHAESVAAFIDPPSGPPAQIPFYAGLDAANPMPLQASIPVFAGSHVRFSCSYANVTGTQEIFQGLDTQTDEMCVVSGTYYPAMDPDAESCALAPDDFGVGAAPCQQTLACASACPAGTAPPPDLGLSTSPNVDPCWQRCVVASCSDASGLLFSLVRCLEAQCQAECADMTSSACAQCQSDQCPTESSACAGDACGG